MFSVSPNPVLVNLGPLSIRYYGLVYALAFLGTYFYLQYLSRHGKLHLDEEAIDNFVLYAIVGVVAGGRIGEFLFYQPARLLSDPLALLRIWEGGMAFHGGIIGVAIATALFCRRYNIPFYHLSDNLTIPASLALFFGRITNFINAELLGTPTTLPWGVNWFNEINSKGELLYRHPSQIYEAITNLSQAVILYVLQTKKSFTKTFKVGSGFYTWLFIFMYGLMRAVVNVWRDDTRWIFGVLGTGQILSITMALIALVVIYKKYLRK